MSRTLSGRKGNVRAVSSAALLLRSLHRRQGLGRLARDYDDDDGRRGRGRSSGVREAAGVTCLAPART